MVAPSTRNILIAFIASPGDVVEERRAAREVVEELNKVLRIMNWQIDLLGWEDTMPGVARPQELINKDLDACGLLIGLLWKRWGQSTGEYSSGFEEEFERALRRRKDTGSPEIWLSFKNIDVDLLKDPGEQLRQVMAFRDKQIELRQVLFKEFGDVEEWKTLLRNWLLQYIFELDRDSRQPSGAMSNAAATSPAGAPATAALTEEADTRPAHEQLVRLVNAVVRAVEEQGSQSQGLPMNRLDSFEIARHYLFSTTLMSSQTPSTMPGVHESQRIYLFRERLEPDSDELVLLFRTLINDKDGLIPAWYWLSWLTPELLRVALLERATSDRDLFVRMRAWETLAAARISPDSDQKRWEFALRAIDTADSPFVKRAAISYLGVVGTERELPTIEAALNGDRDPLVRREASISRLLVLARTDPDRIFGEALPELLSDKRRVISELKTNAGTIGEEALMRALEHADEEVRFFALEELKRRGALTKVIAASLLKDSSGKVSELCYRYLLEQGEAVDPRDVVQNVKDETHNLRYNRDSMFRTPPHADPKGVALEILRGYGEEDLWKLVDWDSPIGDVAYKALALYHFPQAGERIRVDLDEGFKRYEGPFLELATARWAEFYSTPDGMSLRHYLGLLGGRWRTAQSSEENTPEASAGREAETAMSKYIAAALSGLAANGEAKDVDFGRKYLSHADYDAQLEAVKIVERFGNDGDVQTLIEVAKTAEGVLKEAAASAAMRLSRDERETARSLLLTKDAVLATIAVSSLLDDVNLGETAFFLERHLLERSDIIRKKAVAYLAEKLPEEELTRLLERYTGQASYFYDVVCWLDRILYAPTPLKEAFIRQLEGELILSDQNV